MACRFDRPPGGERLTETLQVLELIDEDSSGQFALTEKGKAVLANPGA
jgi:hypothetical protein